MHKIHHWKAQRSSDSMTIVGRDDVGQALKIARVVSIDGAAPYPIATDAHGVRYQLVCEDADVLPGLPPLGDGQRLAA